MDLKLELIRNKNLSQVYSFQISLFWIVAGQRFRLNCFMQNLLISSITYVKRLIFFSISMLATLLPQSGMASYFQDFSVIHGTNWLYGVMFIVILFLKLVQFIHDPNLFEWVLRNLVKIARKGPFYKIF